jgi:hypothetical protein
MTFSFIKVLRPFHGGGALSYVQICLSLKTMNNNTYRALDNSLTIVRDWNLAAIWQTIKRIIPATDHRSCVHSTMK